MIGLFTPSHNNAPSSGSKRRDARRKLLSTLVQLRADAVVIGADFPVRDAGAGYSERRLSWRTSWP